MRHRMHLVVTASIALALLGLRTSASQPTPPSMNTLEELINDMTLPHEGRMHGVPDSYDWSQRPRVGMGSNPGSFRAIIAWGQVYEAAEGNPASNSRVQIKDLSTYILDRQGRWTRLQFSAAVQGAAYVEDFAGDVNKPADIRPEPDGGSSVTVGGGYNFHFWTSNGRSDIDPNSIAGVYTTYKARLVLHDPKKPDDRQRARFLASCGADYWLSKTAAWDNFKTNGDVGIGRAKFVRREWRSISMHTLTPQQLRQNPPPL